MSAQSAGLPMRAGADEALPLAERMVVLQYVRAGAVLLVLLGAAAGPEVLAPGRRQAVVSTLAYALVVLLAELVWRRLGRRVVLVLGLLLILDGVWLAWVGYVTGGLDSPLRYVTLLHVAAVALVASYRTGLKIALWHSLLIVATHNGVQSGYLTRTDRTADGALESQHLVVLIVVLWLVALSTSALSAVNERELRRRRRDLEALTELALRLESADGPAAAADVLLGSALDTMGPGRGVVLGGSEGRLSVLAPPPPDGLPAAEHSSTVVEEAQGSRRTLLVRHLDADGDQWLQSLLPGARDLVVVPLSAEGGPLGALVLECSGGRGRRARTRARTAPRATRVPRRVVAALERAASYASLALRNAWLLEEVRRLAATDGLTRIANRRTFETALEREVARATRSGERLSLVMLDIDHFKRLNDEHGHQAGDEVLRDVAAALTSECRDFDTPARYGGEEFAVVLPRCGPEEAAVIAERLRVAVSAAPAALPVTASAGVATFPTHADGAYALVRAADEALYDSKRAGRDRTSTPRGAAGGAEVEALLAQAAAQRPMRPAGGPPSRPAVPAPSPSPDVRDPATWGRRS